MSVSVHRTKKSKLQHHSYKVKKVTKKITRKVVTTTKTVTKHSHSSKKKK